jgi:hypothetical protein
MKNLILAFIAIFFLMASCSSNKIIEAKPEPKPLIPVCENGTEMVLKKIHLDGCNWVLTLPTGENLEPMNISNFISVSDDENGLELNVKVEYKETPAATICMIGKTITITCFEVIR